MGKGKLCALFGKGRSAIYDYEKRLLTENFSNDVIIQHVQKLRVKMPRLGARKLHYLLTPMLREHGICLGRDQLFNLLSANNLLIRQRKRKVITTNSRHWMRKYANQARDMVISRPEQLWVSDITYIRLINQWGYLSLVTDAYSRQIMGHCFRTDMSAQGCIQALQMAIANRSYPNKSLLHHSDRGSQYCSADYVKLLYESRTGFESTKALIQQSIDTYNQHRPHSSCDMLTPAKAHQQNGTLKKRWKNYSWKPKDQQREPGKKEAGAAPLTEQDHDFFLPADRKPISLNQDLYSDYRT